MILDYLPPFVDDYIEKAKKLYPVFIDPNEDEDGYLDLIKNPLFSCNLY